jgi:hypothetical protein
MGEKDGNDDMGFVAMPHLLDGSALRPSAAIRRCREPTDCTVNATQAKRLALQGKQQTGIVMGLPVADCALT